jgi:hypothetical protein
VTVRVQVKYYWPDEGRVGSDPGEHLAASNGAAGGKGIIDTTGRISDIARKLAASRKKQ